MTVSPLLLTIQNHKGLLVVWYQCSVKYLQLTYSTYHVNYVPKVIYKNLLGVKSCLWLCEENSDEDVFFYYYAVWLLLERFPGFDVVMMMQMNIFSPKIFQHPVSCYTDCIKQLTIQFNFTEQKVIFFTVMVLDRTTLSFFLDDDDVGNINMQKENTHRF